MNAIRTSIRASISTLALGALLLGCSQDAGLNAADIEYREVRIDLLSHFWETQRLNAEDTRANGTVLEFDDGSEMRLEDPSLLKELPEHVIRSENDQRYIYYKFASEPKSINCLVKLKGWLISGTEEPENAADLLFTRELDWGGEPLSLYTSLDPDHVETWRSNSFECGSYYPGRGLLVRSDDAYVGELIVRY